MKFELVHDPKDNDLQNFCILELGLTKVPDDGVILGFRRKRNPKGVEIAGYFEKYTGEGGSVTAHWAMKKGSWLHPEVVSTILLYVFWDLGCERMFGEVAASNTLARKADEKLGFEEIAVLPGYFPQDDMVVYMLERSKCRFIPEEVRNGQTRSSQRSQ